LGKYYIVKVERKTGFFPGEFVLPLAGIGVIQILKE
jgi:hypothetical protein